MADDTPASCVYLERLYMMHLRIWEEILDGVIDATSAREQAYDQSLDV